MRNRLPFSLLLAAAALLILASSLSLAEPDEPDPLPTASVMAEKLEAKIAETEAASGLGEEAKKRLLDLYRKALDNLKTTNSDTQAAESYARIIDEAPGRIEAQRAATVDLQAQEAGAPDATLSDPLPQLVQRLQKERADLAAVRAQRSEADNRLAELSARPPVIRQRLPLARQQQEELATQLKLPPPDGEDPAISQARRWELESRFQRLNAEIKRLDQELLSQPVRLELLKIERDKALAGKKLAGKRVEILEDLVNRKRQAEAEQTLARAEAIREGAEGKHPLVVRLAERNAALSGEIASTFSVLAGLNERAEQTDRRARRIEADFKSAKETIDIGGLSRELGQMLLQQRFLLPDLNTFRREADERENTAARIGVRRLSHRQEQRRLLDLDAYVASLATSETPDQLAQLDDELRALARERQILLEKAIDSDDLYLRKLGELESAQQRLFDQVKGFDEFMAVYLLWVRSSSPADLAGLGASSEQVWRILSPKGWRQVGHSLLHQVTHTPVFALLVLVLGALLWWRKRIVAAIPPLGTSVGKPRIDRFSYTLQAFVLTLVTAAGLPLLMLVTGWQLEVSSEGTSFSIAVGQALVHVAAIVFFVRFFRMACIEQGLAEAHYCWPAARVQLLRAELDRLTWIFLPAAMVVTVAVQLDPLNGGWAIGRVAFLVLAGSLSFAFYRLLHPDKGIFASPSGPGKQRTAQRWFWLGYLVLVAAPLALGVIAVLGYLHAAGILFGELLTTVWVLITVWLLWELARRWLLIAQRRIAYEAAVEERVARWAARHEQEAGDAHAHDHAAPMESEEPEVDLVALSETSKKLLNTVFVFLGVIGLWLVWFDVFPALRVLDGVTLWHHAGVVDGDEQMIPITLADIGLAAVYAVVTVVLMNQLPAVLEIILLQTTEMTASSRYTATTLTNYLIVIAGAVLVSVTIGVEWSKLQWLVAALGVGIGFGLQEIVANFISGLIILFERPVRVGDLITVGDASGRVERIRIRATTIRDFEQKQLLIPNKELITGRLLNWTLSDELTRILINVGIAYGSDVDRAMEILLELAREDERVLEEPAPGVVFDRFADSSLNLAFRVFVGTLADRLPVMTDMHREIHRRFAEAGITIAFPQRDLHMDTLAPLKVEVVGGGRVPSGEVK
jgi:potassium efflux system protein